MVSVLRRCFGRSDRRAQADRPTLRSIRPTRATTSLAASVDHTEARSVAGFGPDDRAVRRGGSGTPRPREVPWDWSDRGPPLWFGDSLDLPIAGGLIPCSSAREAANRALGYERRIRYLPAGSDASRRPGMSELMEPRCRPRPPGGRLRGFCCHTTIRVLVPLRKSIRSLGMCILTSGMPSRLG